MAIKSIKDLDIKGKRVFIRVDFNVPLDQAGAVRDDTRIRRSLPTIRYAIQQGAKIILASHLGRPKGERKPEMSLKPVAARLSELLGGPVSFAEDCIGPTARSAVEALTPGGVLVLENLRFHAGETKNDGGFAQELASLADVYVNDAFGTAHRAHASTAGITEFVKEKAAGLLLKEELENLAKAFANPRKPVVALFGGAKVSDKLGVLQHLVGEMDSILIGGGMANTFLKAQGIDVGASKIEEEMLPTAREILDAAAKAGKVFLLPSDVVTAEKMEPGVRTRTGEVSLIPSGEMALDIGIRTVDAFSAEISKAGTIVWNGPMGVFEMEPFKMGTLMISRAVAASPGFSVVGGGDTIRAVEQFGVADRISYISTGGGAFMEFMEGKTLPGVAALEE
ncbi:MAG: phosphoglycerate kinase [Thermodesulfobacteriota bacterium]